MDKNILVIEDEIALLNIMEAYFLDEGYQVFLATNGLEGLRLFQQNDIDLVCCDILMPNMDGYEVVKNIRKISDVPFIFITALTSEKDQLAGYKYHIDDYVTKPFSPSVLMMKVKSILSRVESSVSKFVKNIDIDDLHIDIIGHSVFIKDEEIHLSKTEFDVLAYLVNNHGSAVDRITMLDEIWGMEVYVDERVVDTNVKVLRKKLKEYGKLIKTVFGVGYKFEFPKDQE